MNLIPVIENLLRSIEGWWSALGVAIAEEISVLAAATGSLISKALTLYALWLIGAAILLPAVLGLAGRAFVFSRDPDDARRPSAPGNGPDDSERSPRSPEPDFRIGEPWPNFSEPPAQDS